MIADALAARQAEIGRAIARRVVDEIPEYARAPEDVLEDLLAGATATVGLLARAFEGNLNRADLAVIRDLAARRVHQGVSLEAFLHAYRVALFAYWDACAEEATRADLSRDESLDLAKRALDAMDLMTSQAAEGYLREEARLRVESGRQARDAIERMLSGRPPGDIRLPAAPFVTIVGQATDEAARDALRERLPRALIARREDEIVIVATAADATRAALEQRGHFGVSLPASDYTGIRQAYREASLARGYATGARPIVALAELSAFECLLVGADATTRAVIAAKPSLDDEDAATVEAFAAADLNVSRAAAALHVHPNTVRYRLERIATETGHDPRTFSGLVELELRNLIFSYLEVTNAL
ncbi:helix-turn-helix domain-containing protein [Solirubrobacter ginsenosidimutans]|uniref:Helix-turn-helix domain-containing protein n=1 Tax=Solirubrobacter ginsenosidimutans TaxID=490573 RepID=A0A9X3MVQ6_9ACTN|nr:helix-turn-helix domain-containing protein [Solirubrobacter ginsenosidimutans]MDA0162125.1 helix-turn-helix domain-containing protein [Solirubrobacter ginsenosidimutans]